MEDGTFSEKSKMKLLHHTTPANKCLLEKLHGVEFESPEGIDEKKRVIMVTLRAVLINERLCVWLLIFWVYLYGLYTQLLISVLIVQFLSTDFWACVSDESYDDTRGKVGYFAYRIIGYDDTAEYPTQTQSLGWTYTVPIDITTMTEVTGMPK